MKLHLPWRKREQPARQPEGEEREALKMANEHRSFSDQVVRSIGRENLDEPFRGADD
jgi:hypothetical protein